jgi:hypothetical protein
MVKRINWLSKGVDLLIVILGITIAFNLNTWKDFRRNQSEAREYLKSFLDECQDNRTALQQNLEAGKQKQNQIDSLIDCLEDPTCPAQTIQKRSLNMLSLANKTRFTTTMDNITYSGDFSLIRDKALRKQILELYASYEGLDELEDFSLGYIKTYFGPLLLENRRAEQLLSASFRSEMSYLALVYRNLVIQQTDGYDLTIQKLDTLIEALQERLQA